MTTLEQRMTVVENKVSSIEATLEHLATKSDVAEIKVAMAEMKEELMTQLSWRMFGMVLGMFLTVSSVAAVAIALAQTVFD